jgi:hypothetical protein
MGLRPYKVSHETFILLTILLIMQGIHIHFVFLANVLRETVNDLMIRYEKNDILIELN